MRLASEDVVINAPLSYAGAAQRIIRLRRRAEGGGAVVALTALAVLLIAMAWIFVTAWYMTWGLLLVPYRVLRRGARKRKAEALRHRELLGTIQGSAAGSAAALVAATATAQGSTMAPPMISPNELVGDVERDQLVDELRGHMLAGRLTAGDLEMRVDAAHRARTRADLETVRADLPVVQSRAVGGTAPESTSV